MLQKIKEFLLVEFIYFAHRLLRLTWKKVSGPYPAEIQQRIDQGLPTIFGHLHQDDISLSAFYIGKPVGVLVSHSKDGNLLTRFFHKIGFKVARGSSSRGAASGFLELLRISQEEKLCYITFAADGPRGPVGLTKNGIFKLAEILNAPVVPTVALADRRWTFRKSWSKGFIPKPFARVEAHYLKPLSAQLITEKVKNKDYSALATIFNAQISEAKGKGYF
jgi:lysophospholipid acyltransferase (LPLAT)-like uncharacterized protein